MIWLADVELRNIVVDHVGNKSREEELKTSRSSPLIQEKDIRNLLMKYFLSPFNEKEYLNFTHESDLELNELSNHASNIFVDPDCFYLQTINIVKHLFEKSTHPKVKGGEVYLIYLE